MMLHNNFLQLYFVKMTVNPVTVQPVIDVISRGRILNQNKTDAWIILNWHLYQIQTREILRWGSMGFSTVKLSDSNK